MFFTKKKNEKTDLSKVLWGMVLQGIAAKKTLFLRVYDNYETNYNITNMNKNRLLLTEAE